LGGASVSSSSSAPQAVGALRPSAVVWIALTAFVLLLFPDLVLRGRVLFERDISLMWQPQAESFVRAVTGGSWPLWDPYVAFGRPMLANPNTQVLYPVTWLNLVLGPGRFFTLYTLGHLLLAGAGTFLLARRLALSAQAAFLAAAAFTASGPLLSVVNAWNHLPGAALLPWACLAAELALSSGLLRYSVLWGAALALQLLAGSPDMAVFTGITGVAWVLWHLGRERFRGSRRKIVSAAIALAFALALSAGQVLPSLAAASLSARWALDAGRRIPWSTHPFGLLESLTPVPWSELPLNAWARGVLYDGAEPFLHSLYLGVTTCGLAALALAGPRRKGRGLLFLLLLGFALLALGRHTPVYEIVLRLLPPLQSLRYPSKALVVVAFAVSLLAGMGLETWRDPSRPRWQLWTLAVFSVALGLAGLGSVLVLSDPRSLLGPFLLNEETLGTSWADALRPLLPRLGVPALAWLALGALTFWRSLKPTAGLPAIALGLTLFDLWAANRSVNPSAPPDIYSRRPPLSELVRQDDHSRLYVYRYPLRPAPPHPALSTDNPYRIAWYPQGYDLASGRMLAARLYPMPPSGAAFGLCGSYDPDLLGLYPTYLADLLTAMQASEATPAYRRFLQLGAVTRVAALHTRGLENLVLLRELSTPFVLPVRLFEVPGALPRTFVVGRARRSRDVEALRMLADPTFDPTREIVLPPGAPPIHEPSSPSSPGKSRILAIDADRIRIAADLAAAGYVVLVDAYDPGWQATVDGQPAAVLRANVAFRAVAVGPGHHDIDLVYRPRSVLVGVSITAAALLLAVTLLTRGRRSGVNPAPPGEAPTR
jgi:hypothetical protein